MRDAWLNDLQRVSPALQRLILPTLIQECKAFGGGQFQVIEGKVGDELSHDLDVLAGIDAYQRWASAMRGIALRVQDDGTDYRSFTIRTSRPSGVATEYSKRLYAIKHKDQGLLYPYWTIQAYLSEPDGELLSMAIAKTEELYLYTEENFDNLPGRTARNGGQGFKFVRWNQYRADDKFCEVVVKA